MTKESLTNLCVLAKEKSRFNYIDLVIYHDKVEHPYSTLRCIGYVFIDYKKLFLSTFEYNDPDLIEAAERKVLSAISDKIIIAALSSLELVNQQKPILNSLILES